MRPGRAEVLGWLADEERRTAAIAVELGEAHRIHPSRESRRRYHDAAFAHMQASTALRCVGNLDILANAAAKRAA